MTECTLPFCEGEYYAGGLCKRHYQANQRFGTPLGKETRDVVALLKMSVASLDVALSTIKEFSGGECANCDNPDAHDPGCPVAVRDALRAVLELTGEKIGVITP